MRGTEKASGSLFSYVDLEKRIPARHPLRKIRQVVNDALASLDAEFEALYTDFGRPSIPPERLIRASLLQILFSVAHDPTQLNRQGPDSGAQYRSAIFTTSDEQKKEYARQETIRVQKHNAAVTEMEGVADRFNTQLKAYRARQAKKN